MNVTTLTTIFSILTQLVQFLQQNGPGIITGVEGIISDLQLAWQSLTSTTAITPAQQQLVDTALSNANTALQQAIAAKTTPPAGQVV